MVKLLFAGILVSNLAVAGTTVMISPTRDTAIYEENNNANGAGSNLFLGRIRNGSARRSLIAFDDLSQIPPGGIILSAELQIQVNRGRGGALASSIHSLSTDWGEGTSLAGGAGGQGAPPSNGGATWNDAFFPDTDWQQPGGDFDPVQLSSVNVPSSGSVTFPSTPALVASVQAWADGTAPNHGWLLRADPGAPTQSAKRFGSRENGAASSRPVLIVEFEESLPVTLSELTISGPMSLPEDTNAEYTATATFSDGSMTDVTDQASWSDDSAFADIGQDGLLTTFGVGSDQIVAITASFTSGEIERSDTLTVVIEDLSQQINYGLAGAWFNPLTSGQGFLFDFLLDEQFMFVAAFTFDTTAAVKGGTIEGAGQRWFTAQGTYAGSRADLLIFQTRNGVFDDPTTPDTTEVGTMTVEFDTCTEATISYDLPDFGLSGVIPVTKLLADEICTRINDGEIEIKSQTPAAIPAGESQPINYGLIGGWFDLATAGQGFLFDFQLDSEFMFVAWFTFDAAVDQKGGSIPGDELRWFTAQGNYSGSRAELTLFSTRNGVFDDPTVPTTDPVGTMVIEPTSCTTAEITYDLPGFELSGVIPVSKLLADEICTRINEGGIELRR